MIQKLVTDILVYSALVCISCMALAADPYNTYQWNRANHDAKSGEIDKGPWYEWWYFKVVDPKTDRAFFFVYGVVNPWDHSGENKASRSYLAFGDFGTHMLAQESKGVDAFVADYDATRIGIDGVGEASDTALSGQIQDPRAGDVTWNLTMKKDWAFNAMGWGIKIPDLVNIYWYPAQASATISGTIKVGAQTIELQDAPAYQDRNWGRSFPTWWAWIVSNQFKNSPGTALVAGGGKPTVLGKFQPLQGVSIGFRLRGQTYTFRMNEGAHVETHATLGAWDVVAENLKRSQKLVVTARAPLDKFMLLPFSTPDGTQFKDYETLNGNLRVKLYERDPLGLSDWRLITDVESDQAGIEYGSF